MTRSEMKAERKRQSISRATDHVDNDRMLQIIRQIYGTDASTDLEDVNWPPVLIRQIFMLASRKKKTSSGFYFEAACLALKLEEAYVSDRVAKGLITQEDARSIIDKVNVKDSVVKHVDDSSDIGKLGLSAYLESLRQRVNTDLEAERDAVKQVGLSKKAERDARAQARRSRREAGRISTSLAKNNTSGEELTLVQRAASDGYISDLDFADLKLGP